jgi:hypothetical protein
MALSLAGIGHLFSRYLPNPAWSNLIFANTRVVLPTPVEICNSFAEFFDPSANPEPRGNSRTLGVATLSSLLRTAF